MRRVRRISLRNFRSYEALDLDLDGRSLALTGPNGSGKTNLLEALSFMGPGRGLRRATLEEAGRQGAAPGWGVGLTLIDETDAEDRITLALQVKPPAPLKKTMRIEGEAISTASRLLDYLHFSWLTPAQDRLFVEGASERRRFLDRMTLAQDKAHGTMSSAYEKAMRQRQAVFQSGRIDASLLNVLEAQMAEAGVAIAAARRQMVAVLAAGYENIRSGAFPQASLALEGTLETALETKPTADVEEEFAERLSRNRHRDAEAGRALIGPHRSDLFVTHTEKDQAAKYCSTGEQKALLIGLVLAHAASLRSRQQAPLILLLDEVAAHLDEARRVSLADIIEGLGAQAFMTGTDHALFAPWGDRAAHLSVQNGQILPA